MEIMTWSSEVAEGRTLKNVKHSEYLKINSDISRIRNHVGGQHSMYQFVRVPCCGSGQQDYDDLFVYEHSRHFSYSSIKMTMIARLCVINESSEFIAPCLKSQCHESFFPYFFGNEYCKSFATHFPRLAELLGKEIFRDTEPAGVYSEDDWTERLHHCLIFNNFHSELLARLRGEDTKKSWRGRLPNGVNENCLLFQGSPDFIVRDLVCTSGLGDPSI